MSDLREPKVDTGTKVPDKSRNLQQLREKTPLCEGLHNKTIEKLDSEEEPEKKRLTNMGGFNL